MVEEEERARFWIRREVERLVVYVITPESLVSFGNIRGDKIWTTDR